MFKTICSHSLQYHCLRLASSKSISLKGKSKSSQEWLLRQNADPYVEKAKMLNYRCRSAFKLLEIENKHQILHPGQTVIDCGAAPGSWTQIAVNKTNADESIALKPKGFVLGVDILPIFPIKGAILIGNTDFTTLKGQAKIKEALNGSLANCILSDMAPSATGIRSLDQEQQINLCYSVLRFAVTISLENASLLIKVWDNAEVPVLIKDILKYYKTVKIIKPNASRSESSEKFILARDFIGLITKSTTV